MGFSLYNEFDNAEEQPQHRVQISKSFYLGVAHEVTLGQFLHYYNADKVNHKTDAERDGKGGWGFDGKKSEQKVEYVAWNTGWNKPVEQYMNHPVVNVSWNDSVAFCAGGFPLPKARDLRRDGLTKIVPEALADFLRRGSTNLSAGSQAGINPCTVASDGRGPYTYE